jgi:hypothetical protein
MAAPTATRSGPNERRRPYLSEIALIITVGNGGSRLASRERTPSARKLETLNGLLGLTMPIDDHGGLVLNVLELRNERMRCT